MLQLVTGSTTITYTAAEETAFRSARERAVADGVAVTIWDDGDLLGIVFPGGEAIRFSEDHWDIAEEERWEIAADIHVAAEPQLAQLAPKELPAHLRD